MGQISAKFDARPRSWGGRKPRETVLIQELKAPHPAEVVETAGTPGERIQKFNALRRRDVEFAEWCEPYDREGSRAVLGCSRALLLRHYESAAQTRVTAVLPDFCRRRFMCSLCDAVRAGKTLAQYVDKVLTVLRGEHWMMCPYLVTLTVKDGDDLRERMNHLRESHRKLMARRRRMLSNRKSAGKRSRFKDTITEAGKADGGVYSIEVKRGKGSGQWHPHLHAVWLCCDEPRKYDLAEEWYDITGDSHVVDVQRFYSVTESEHGYIIDREGLGKDMREVCKYSLKFSDMEFEDQLHAAKTLRRGAKSIRMVGSFGKLRGLGEAEIECDTRLESLDAELQYVDLLYDWSSESRQYALTNIARGGVNVRTGEEVFAK